MANQKFQTYLDELGLTQIDAARLLSVSPRSIRRWSENPIEIPGPAVQALCAWVRLHRLGFPWRPDAVVFGENDHDKIAEQIARHRQHTIDLDALIENVKARGGPAAPWHVDLNKREATLGPISVSFYRLTDGGFSPSFYRRSDIHSDIKRDWPLLEDAFACIASAIASTASD